MSDTRSQLGGVPEQLDRFFRDAYMYGSASKVCYAGRAAAEKIRSVYSEDEDGLLRVAQFRMRLVERDDVLPDSAYVVDAR